MSRYASPVEINASEGLGALIHYVNQVTQNWFSNMLLIGIWFIVLMGFYKAKDDFSGALAVAGYCTFVVGILFWVGGWVSSWAFGIVVAMTILGTIVLLMDQKG